MSRDSEVENVVWNGWIKACVAPHLGGEAIFLVLDRLLHLFDQTHRLRIDIIRIDLRDLARHDQCHVRVIEAYAIGSQKAREHNLRKLLRYVVCQFDVVVQRRTTERQATRCVDILEAIQWQMQTKLAIDDVGSCGGVISALFPKICFFFNQKLAIRIVHISQHWLLVTKDDHLSWDRFERLRVVVVFDK